MNIKNMKAKHSTIIIIAFLFFFACNEEEKPPIIEISVSTNEIVVPPEGGSYKVIVSSNVDWEVNINYSDFSWCSVNGNSQINDTIYIEVARNNVAATKKTDMKVSNSNVINDNIVFETITITQQGWAVPEDGVLINGIIWAKCNVDDFGTFAESPYHTGKLYQYNDAIGYTTVICDEINGNRKPVPAWIPNTFSDTWQPENNPCPAGWRMPTSGELYALSKSGYTYNDELNGYFLGANSEFATREDAKDCIFIPAAGKIENGDVSKMFEEGYYWAQDGRSIDDEGYIKSMFLKIYDDDIPVKFVAGITLTIDAYSIRCVKED